ncbi:MAG: O-antigen ligase family protein, partial [Deinococcus sp.]
HWEVLIAWALLAGVIVSSALAPDPAVAFTGNPSEGSDSAVWFAGLIAVFSLVYVRARQDRGLASRLAGAALASAGLLALGAVLEVRSGHSLFSRVLHQAGPDAGTMPMVTFPQKGHLAGWLALGAAVAYMWRGWPLPWTAALCALLGAGLGTTENRSSLLALGVAVLLVLLLGRSARPPGRSPAHLLGLAAVLVVSVGAGTLFAQSGNAHAKVLSDTTTGSTRSVLWAAAARGIVARPLSGWGGGQFHAHWLDFVSPQQLRTFLREEYQVSLVRRAGNGMLVRDKAGHLQPMFIAAWKAHNQILDVGVMYGAPVALLYLLLFLAALRHWRQAPALATALCAYGVFLVFWYMTENAEGAVFVLWGALAASGGGAGVRQG